jgi:transposase
MEFFKTDFKSHGGNLNNIVTTTCDMSLTLDSFIRNQCPNSKIIIDKFHVIKMFNECIDQIRKEESKNNPYLKKSRYLFLKNDTNLKSTQINKRNELLELNVNIATAYSARVEVQRIYDQCKDSDDAWEAFL